MFEPIGEKIKNLANLLYVIFVIISGISALLVLLLFLEQSIILAIAAAAIIVAVGVLFALLWSCMLYAFGTITNTYIDISNHIHKVDGDKYKFTPGDEVYYGGTKNQEHTKPDEYSGYKFNPKAADESDLDEYLNKARKNIK